MLHTRWSEIGSRMTLLAELEEFVHDHRPHGGMTEHLFISRALALLLGEFGPFETDANADVVEIAHQPHSRRDIQKQANHGNQNHHEQDPEPPSPAPNTCMLLQMKNDNSEASDRCRISA